MLRIPQRLTVRSQILALVLAVVLPSAAAVGWALSAVLASEKDATEARIRSISVQVANNLGLLLHEREELLATLAGLSARQAAGTDPCAAMAEAWARLAAERADLAELSDRSTLLLLGLDGRPLCGKGPGALAAQALSDSDWFRRGLLSAGLGAGPALPVAGNGGWIAPLTHPLRTAGGAVVGLLVLPVDLLALQQRVMPTARSAALVAVIDGNDALLMRSVDAARWLGRPSPPQLAALARGVRDAVMSGEGLDGQRRIWAIVGVLDTPWRVVTGVPEDQVLARYRTMSRTSAWAGALGLGLVLALAWGLGNRIVRPIRALADVSAKVAAGDLSARAGVAGPAEVEAVATQFNRMLDARQASQQTLAASEDRYRMLFQSSLDGVLQTRPDGSVLAANPAACAIFGLDEAALCQRGRAGLVDLADPRLEPLLAQRAREGHASGRIRMLRGDGSPFEAELASSLYTSAAGEALTSMVLRDVSRQLADEQARARLELQLRESQKMEAIGTLAGGIAHDFNNILGGLLGNAALAADSLNADHPAHAHLQQISRAGRRARALVQQILAFSRRQGQPPLLQRQPLRPLVDESLALLRATLPAGVQLVATLADEPIEVACDATQMQQVLMNLCTNAWHAVERGHGRIGVLLERVDFAADEAARPIRLPAGPCAHLQVSDNGRGMDEATRERIFEPFFTTKPIGQGTGLGLSVVHGIIAAHGGEITVHSRPGQGSCFDVYLPLTDAPAAVAPPGASVRLPAGRGQHVLCVDDDEVMLLMTGQLLERAGYCVTSLPRVADALAALRQAPQAFDLVVTDFNMPDGSGLDVAREALQQRPDLPVVLSSGYLPEDLRTEALAAGVRAILMKEHTVDELPALVARLLSSST